MKISFEVEVPNDTTGVQLAALLTTAMADISEFPVDEEGRLFAGDTLRGEYAVIWKVDNDDEW